VLRTVNVPVHSPTAGAGGLGGKAARRITVTLLREAVRGPGALPLGAQPPLLGGGLEALGHGVHDAVGGQGRAGNGVNGGVVVATMAAGTVSKAALAMPSVS